MTRFLALLLTLWVAIAPAFAQWQVPNHATPQGRGAAKSGFTFFGPCNTNVPHVGQTGADGTCWTGNALGTVPSLTTDIPNKAYVDALASGLLVLAASTYATAAVLPNTPTYANGASGVGATLTAGSNTTLTVDGVVAALNDVVLVKNQASTFQNGIYKVTTVGSGAAAWVLTRVTYFDQAAEMLKGSYTVITNGATNSGTSWVLQNTIATVGTDAVLFNLFQTSIGLQRGAGVSLGSVNENWVPPNPNKYHLFIPNAVEFNQNSLWVAVPASVTAAFVPPTGTRLLHLISQIWITSGVYFNGGANVTSKWYKNATVDGNNNLTAGQEVCAGVATISFWSTQSGVARADCIDIPTAGDYYNLFMFVDSTSLGSTAVIIDGNPKHTYAQAYVAY